MAFNIKASLRAVESHLLSGGYFGSDVRIGEPKSPPEALLSAAIFMGDVSVVQLTVAGNTIERHTVFIRIYENAFNEPEEDIELTLADVTSRVMASLVGEYDLGATIRNVDVGGQHGEPLRASWGYETVGGKVYRLVDILLGLIVDDSATAAA